MNQTVDKRELRRSLLKHRRSLSPKQHIEASFALARNARLYRKLFACKRVLSYSAFAGEIDPTHLLTLLTADCYLPKIVNFRTKEMHFFPAGGFAPLSKLGIAEPSAKQQRITARQFDAVLLPLVGFDRSGNRLGMGAGFYDRAFAFRGCTKNLKRPLLIGLAHHFQESQSLTRDVWDVPLDAIITDRELIETSALL